jgi:hypothetical protein
MVTFAPGTTAPEESDTNPTMDPTSFCANAVAEKNIAITIVNAARQKVIQPGVDVLTQLCVDTLFATG